MIRSVQASTADSSPYQHVHATPPSPRNNLRLWLRYRGLGALLCLGLAMAVPLAKADDPEPRPKAFIDGQGPGWKELTLNDFKNVNCYDSTWKFEDGVFKCTGDPVGVIQSTKRYKNLELVVEWKHLTSGGNSGVFLWASDEALTGLKPNQLPPGGIEVQVLDHGFAERWEKETGKKSDWFTTNGDVFPVGKSDMKPFEPSAPGGKRSFPRKELSRGHGEWNHYYVRAINGEVRLWVNGEEVSGGTECTPSEGWLCLESEGAPVEFRGLRIRELP